MNDEPTDHRSAAELRRQAEARLPGKPGAGSRPQTKDDLRRLQHELEVHQIELEMQNEELQRAQALTQAALEKYADLYDFAPTGYFSLDCDGVILAVNLAGARLVGIERARLVNSRLETLIPDADRPAFRSLLQRTFTGEGRETCEVALLAHGSSPVTVRIEAVLSKDGGECRASVLDVTERVNMEGELRKNESLLRMMIAHSIEPMVLISEEGAILCVSNRAAAVLGYAVGELEGAPVSRILYSLDRVSLALHYEDLKKNAPLPASAMLRVYKKSGDWCWVSASVTFEDPVNTTGKYLVKFEVVPVPESGQ